MEYSEALELVREGPNGCDAIASQRGTRWIIRDTEGDGVDGEAPVAERITAMITPPGGSAWFARIVRSVVSGVADPDLLSKLRHSSVADLSH